jgi:hypothetical protein
MSPVTREPHNPFVGATEIPPIISAGPAPKRAPEGPQLRPQRHILRPVEEYIEYEEESQLRIPRDEWPQHFALKWVTESVWGQPFPQVRARSEKAGWVPVHQEDFEGRYRGRFMPASYEGEIKLDGLVLMARPQTWSDKALQNDIRRAHQRVMIKEQQLRSGDLTGVTLSPQHPTALRTNVIERSIDTIQVPQK